MSEKKEYSLAEIAKHTDSIVVGDSMAIVNNLSTLEKLHQILSLFYQIQNIVNLSALQKHRQ